jgi:hypothetical protein
MKNSTIFFAISLDLAGCAAPPVAAEKTLKVQVHTQMSTILDRCINLGAISARAIGEVGMNHSIISSGAEKARFALREQTYHLGGDKVAFLGADFLPPNQMQAQGQALKCG